MLKKIMTIAASAALLSSSAYAAGLRPATALPKAAIGGRMLGMQGGETAAGGGALASQNILGYLLLGTAVVGAGYVTYKVAIEDEDEDDVVSPA